MSNNPYVQVALTYVRRPFSSWQTSFFTSIALAAGVFAILLFFSVFQLVPVAVAVKPNETVTLRVRNMYPDSQTDFVGASAMLLVAAFLSGFLAMHVKEQFAESRSTLMPNFRRIHTAVAAVATLILAVVAPAILSWSMGLRSVGLLAITVFVCGAMFWSVLVLSNWMIWPMLTMVVVGLSQSARHALIVLVSGQFEALVVGLLALGATIVVLAGMRLFRLNEEMPEYYRRMPMGWAAKGRMSDQNVDYDGPWPRVVMDWFQEQAITHLTRHVRYAAGSPWSRICRWRIGTPTGWRVLLWGLFPFGYFQLLSWYLPLPMSGAVQNSMATSTMVANSFAFLPMILIMPQLVGWLMMRTRTLAYELMLPVGRRSYVRQLITGLATSYFEFCGVILTSTVLWCLLAVAIPPPLGYVGSLAAAVVLTQVCQFGVVVFAHTITSLRILRFAVVMLALIGSMLLITGGARGQFPITPRGLADSGRLGGIGRVACLYRLSPLAGGGFRLIGATRFLKKANP